MGAVSYAEYAVYGLYESGQKLSFIPVLDVGDNTSLPDPQNIELAPGRTYFIYYVVLGSQGTDNYIQILPFMNRTPMFRYASAAGNSAPGSNGVASAGAGFLLHAVPEGYTLLNFTYTGSGTKKVDLSGAVTIITLA